MKVAGWTRLTCLVAFFCVAAVIAAPAQTFETVADFNGTNGISPSGALVLGMDGNLYGTTLTGGTTLNSDSNCTESGCGTVFKMTTTGVLTTLYNFCALADCADGAGPGGSLVQDSDGNFYGTTYNGGAHDSNGTVFQITTAGVLTTLYSFCALSNCTDGSLPEAGLVQGSNGDFYGTTRAGGAYGGGTFFQITPGGTLTTLYSFCSLSNCTDGMWPEGGLVKASNGNFYGTTHYGGAHSSDGTVFEITTAGVLTTLYSFCSLSNCADGMWPEAGLIQGSNGDFYGTTYYGGAYGSNGTVFQITSGGVLTTLYSFCALSGCADGSLPQAGLVQGTDGNFFGTTTQGGTPKHPSASADGCFAGCGTFFQITSSGTLTTLWSFCFNKGCSDGSFPAASPIQLSDGTFYDTTVYGSDCAYNTTGGCGTVFSLSNSVALDPTFTPSSLSFADQKVGTTSKSVKIKNVNTGAETLDFTGFTVSAPFAISANTCGATLAAGKTCKVSITFTPTATGTATGTLSVSDNAPLSPQTVSVSGTGD